MALLLIAVSFHRIDRMSNQDCHHTNIDPKNLSYVTIKRVPPTVVKLSEFDRFSCVRSLSLLLVGKIGNSSDINASLEYTKTTRLDAAALLTGLLASNEKVAKVLTSLATWDEFSSVLAAQAELVDVPKYWLDGSLENIRSLGNSNGEDNIGIDFEASAAHRNGKAGSSRYGSSVANTGLSSAMISMTGLTQMASITSSSLEDAFNVIEAKRHNQPHRSGGNFIRESASAGDFL